MIILRRYRVMMSPTGKRRLVNPKIIAKWENEHDFGFVIFKKEEWLLFLQKHKNKEGKPLTRVSPDKEEVAYEVYVWGVPLWMKDYFNKIGVNDGHINLFPGYKEGKKKPIEIYGVLQRSKVLKDRHENLYIETIW